ncbi:MAG TPA: extracellular solute-binding protein [Gaiellaceae bacterium]|nr:extracellular solute-binding protein [Gaiellaceae bacterium]
MALSGAPSANAASTTFDGTIRVLGLGYDLLDPIREQAQRDLGFQIVSKAEFPPVIQRLVRQEPATFDVFSCFQQDVAEFWTTGNLQPVETARVRRWKDITPLYRLGKAQPGSAHCTYGQGDAAFRRLYVDPGRSGRWKSAPGLPAGLSRLLVQWVDESTRKTVGSEPQFCTGVPGTFNFDSFGYNSGVIKKEPEALSWAELVNKRWQGRVGLNGFDPQTGLQDAANAVQAAGLIRFGDLGDPTRKEIDRLVKVLFTFRKQGQFFGVWPQGGDPRQWMRAKEVVVCTMLGDQISSLAAVGFPVRQSAPREGYRAWAGLFSISAAVTDPATLDACYAFLNWWHSGYAGAVLMSEGHYNAVQATTRRFVTPGEYAYWINGKPADQAYSDPFGDPAVAKARIRDGGSFTRRACRISSWNSTPRQQQYFLERWDQFISSF